MRLGLKIAPKLPHFITIYFFMELQLPYTHSSKCEKRKVHIPSTYETSEKKKKLKKYLISVALSSHIFDQITYPHVNYVR